MSRTCDACPAELRFVKSAETDRWLPLQLLEEVPDDQLERVRSYYKVHTDEIDLSYVAQRIERDEAGPAVVLYISHFETCPKASQFSRR